MSEEARFTIHLEQQENYQVNVRFDWKKAADVLLDEPPPLGKASGPNASRMLAAAAANCLSSSLLFCLAKDDPPANSVKTEATCIIVRTETKRLRVGRMEVKIVISDELKGDERLDRCKEVFEDFSIVGESIRNGIPVSVSVQDEDGQVLHQSG
jgi:organic hydroperoxide reductase OsmC/OhrA